jgi:hypothetical protein
MPRILTCACLAALAAIPGIAGPITNCPTTGTLATLIALNPTGCLINNILFENFVVTPSATGTGATPAASQVAYTIDNPGTSTLSGDLIYGFEFNPNLSIAGVGSEDILLNYSIIAPSMEITSIHLLELDVTSGGAVATVAETDRACTGVGTGCVFLPTLAAVPSSPDQEMEGIGPFMEIDVFKDINVSSSSANGIAGISQVRDAVDLQVAPEPSTVALLGLGLAALGLLRRR